jgi:NAD(P)-dependent dehydrogenase (short-subunit alcohol dehydrogenase family)
MFELKDKVIVLTGASGALGSALALSLAESKAN